MADRLWQCHGPAPVAAVEELQSEDDNGDMMAAIPDKKQFQRKKGGHFKGQRARRSCHWAAGCHVPRSIPRAGQGEEEAVLGDRCHADVGFCGPPEAARGCKDSGGSSTTHTWPAAQEGALA